MRVTRHLPSNQIHFNYSLHQQTLEQVRSAKYLGLTITDKLEWLNIFLKFLVKQLRHWVFFGAIWLLHLGTQRKLHTKHWFDLSLSMQLLFGIPVIKLRQKKVEKVQKTAARLTCRRWRNRSCVDDMLDELEWPSLEDRRVKFSLTFFYKIHSGTVSLNKDRYLTPAPNFRSTRASHDLQYTRYMYMAYSDALKNSFFPVDYPFME